MPPRAVACRDRRSPTGQSIGSKRVAVKTASETCRCRRPAAPVVGLQRAAVCRPRGRRAVQEVERVPVAPRLAHGAGVRGRQGARAVVVGDETVGEAVRVLVPDRAGVVAAVDVAEREDVRTGWSRTGTSASAGWRRRAGVDMFALLMWSPSGPPSASGSGAVVGVLLDGVVAREVAVGGVEADRRVGQVVVEHVGQVEGLHAVLLAVGVPRARVRRVPRAVDRVALRVRPLVDRRRRRVIEVRILGAREVAGVVEAVLQVGRVAVGVDAVPDRRREVGHRVEEVVRPVGRRDLLAGVLRRCRR